MELTLRTFLIVCPLVFLAGFVDSIAGGGGIISLPAYLFAGLPPHLAIGTNKLSSACGTTLTVVRFIKEKLVDLKMAIPTVLAALVGSFIGAKLSLLTDETVLKYVLLPVLVLASFIVLNKKLFGLTDEASRPVTRRTYVIASLAALLIGMYDGFYGPGTGSFLIIALNVFAGLSLKRSNAQTKVINLTTTLTALTVFITGGQILWLLGFTAAAFNMLGNWLGSSLSLKSGAKITRPIILVVIALLFVKVIFGI